MCEKISGILKSNPFAVHFIWQFHSPSKSYLLKVAAVVSQRRKECPSDNDSKASITGWDLGKNFGFLEIFIILVLPVNQRT